jgi:CRISPR-associated endonuclease/helicase Cas3
VRETQWHRSEQVEDQPDGSLIWRARVAEPQEMVPWIRGWGGDCEVVEPKELRDRMAGESRQMAEIYGWCVNRGSAAESDTLDKTFASYFGGES